MEQSDVYLVNGSAFSDLAKVACKLTEKAYQQELNVCLITNQNYEAQVLDEALWTFDELSFIPHTLVTNTTESSRENNGENNAKQNGVVIISAEALKHASTPLGKQDILIYLQTELLDSEPAAQRRLVLVPSDAASLTKARTLFKTLKQRGEEVNTHDLRR